MGKDGKTKATSNKHKLNKWAIFYWTNFLDENYKAKVPELLQEIITFEKDKRQARIEVYSNCISFDIRELGKDEVYHNVDRNDEEIIEWVKLTKRWKINILWAVSFVLDMWYTFIEEKFYEEEKTEDLQKYYIWDAIQYSLF